MNAKRWLPSLLILAIFSGALRADSFGSGANSFTIDFVTIGAPGNPGDVTGSPSGAGAVPYEFRMGRYEVPEEAIRKANAATAGSPLGITLDTRGLNQPATSVSWIEAAKFVNWLNTSTGSSPAYKFSATGEPQYWLSTDPGYNVNNLIRNSLARYFIPSVNEWFKSAYFEPVTGVYFNYPTGSDTAPDGTDFLNDPTFDAVFMDSSSNFQPNNIMNVGVASPFGVYGLGGNVLEWNETEFVLGTPLNLNQKGTRGGSWSQGSTSLHAGILGITVAAPTDLSAVGFRVARVVPEPSGLSVAIVVGMLFYRLCLRLSPLTMKLAPLGFCLLVSASTLQADTFGSGANAFSIDLVTIGSPDNPADTTGVPNPAGSVPYSYRIGKYEVPEDAVRKANALSGLGITLDTRGLNKPATSVSWLEIAQFTNWLNTSTGRAPAYKFNTQGTVELWLPSDPGYDSANPLRNRRAFYFIPGVNEWYKAAYYNPAAGVYYDWPTGSNALPDGIDSVGDPQFDAVFPQPSNNGVPNDITDVGVLSPFGTAGQGGNVQEWNETSLRFFSPPSGALVRGGTFQRMNFEMLSNRTLGTFAVDSQSADLGFRVASIVPEPRSLAVCLMAILCCAKSRSLLG